MFLGIGKTVMLLRPQMRAFSFPSFGKKTPNPFKRHPNHHPSGPVDGVEIRLDLCCPSQLSICILFFALSSAGTQGSGAIV